MCNRYHPARASDIAGGFSSAIEEYFGPYESRGIGPFGLAPFIRPRENAYEEVIGQWGMIRPGSDTRKAMKGKIPLMTNNARSETMEKLPTFRQAWADGQRCIIPAWGFDEPNWETGKNIWWTMRRADGQAWGIAGLWSTWTDKETGEVVENFTMPTINVDRHPLLSRLHKPDPELPPTEQDKRSVVPLEPGDWVTWLQGSQDEARGLLRALPVAVYDAGPAR